MGETEKKKKQEKDNAPFVSIVDESGRPWEVYENPFGEELHEGAVGTLMISNRKGPIHEAKRMMLMARLRYPMKFDQDEMDDLGLNGFALELSKRVLWTKALREKGLPVLQWGDKSCREYIQRLIPIIANILAISDRHAEQLAMELTDTPQENSPEIKSLAALAAAWLAAQGGGSGEGGSGDGHGEADEATQEALREMLKQLKEMEEVTMDFEHWFSKTAGIGNGAREDSSTYGKLAPIPPHLAKVIPGYKKGLPWRIPQLIREGLGGAKVAKARSIRPSDAGAVPRFMHRLPIDGMIFGHKKRMSGGSVLFDCSGSMAVTQEQVIRIAKQFPAGVVAGYSGGALRILAEKGHVITKAPAFQGSNECDGPALEWLIRQSAPRFWISDGHVTATDESQPAGLKEHCAALCKWGNVTRIASAAAAIRQIDQLLKEQAA